MITSSRCFLFLMMLTAVVSFGQEEERPYKALIENSPFLTPAFKARLGRHKSVSLNLKFTGYTKVDDTWFLALKDVKTGKNYWLEEKVELDGITVVAFRQKKELINVRVGDIEFDLTLEKR